MKHINGFILFTIAFFCARTDYQEELRKELDAGRARVLSVINDRNLNESLDGHPFISYWINNFWIIVVNEQGNYTAYTGSFSSKDYSIVTVSDNLNSGIDSLFRLTAQQFGRYYLCTSYNGLYYYFVHFSENRSEYIECNSTMSIKKRHKYSILPSEGESALFDIIFQNSGVLDGREILRRESVWILPYESNE